MYNTCNQDLFCQCEGLSTPVIFSVFLKNKNQISALSTGEAKAVKFAIPYNAGLVCTQ